MDVEAAQQIFSAGEHLEQAGKLTQALACYQQATKLHSQNFLYHYKLGKILHQQDRLDRASQCFERAIALNNDDSWSYYALGESYAQQSKISAAIDYYQQAIVLNPNFSWSHYNLARLYHQLDEWEAAKTCYKRAIALEADFFWSHFFLAEILIKLKEHSAAIAHYHRAIELDPKSYRTYYQLARYWQQEGKLEAAVEYYYRGIELNCADFDCYYFLAETLIRLNRADEALRQLEAAIELQPNDLLPYYHLGFILLGRGEQAIADYRSAAERSLLFRVNLELGLAQAWKQQGQLAKSVAACQRAIAIDPTAEMPYRIVQYQAIDPSTIDSVVAFYRKIGNSSPSSPLLWGNLGDLLTKQGQIDEAIDCYRRSCYLNAVAKDPQLAKLDWQQHHLIAPNFIIIGASKCGTTSLFFYLSQHPQILTPHKKEIDFFNHNFDLGLPWYLAQFPAIADAKQFITGGASPSYMYDPLARERIKQLFPDTKLIIMLRNPVKRTISEYYHAVNRDLEQRSLSEIIDTERELLTTQPKEVVESFGYLFNSIYLDKIAKWQADFPQENILIVDSESFFERTEVVMQQIWQFFDLPAISHLQHIRYNVGSYSPVSQQIERQLQEFFAPYNRELAAYLNRRFSWQ